MPSPLTTEAPKTTDRAARPAEGCAHCGEPCPDTSRAREGRNFCCLGCQTVFQLLHENGLERFYTLDQRPGRRVTPGSRARWEFLDDPVVRGQLLDFADATQARVTWRLPQIHCVACVWLLENLFRIHPGVGRVVVNFSRREAAIQFAPDKIKFSELAALLAALGYEPQLTLGETEKAKPPVWRNKSWLQVGMAAFAFGNIMLMSLPCYLGLDSLNGPWFRMFAGWLSLLMALPVVVYSAGDFWRAAWASVRSRVLTMEVPIALGLAAIYGTSIVEVVSRRGPGYCDSLCGLVFFLLCGRLFQRRTYDRITFDRDYKGFFPLSVVRKTGDQEATVAISRLQTGDRLVLRNGELLPADARLIQGEARMDYSFVTGESEPVACAPGDQLYAGGRQSGGAIEVETIKPVAQSYLATLWNNEAFRKEGTELDSLTNRYSRRFTVLVLVVALGAAVFWLAHDPARALRAFTAVLIVACPCALALAAPLTHGTVQRLLARRQIFLKNAMVVERMATVDTVVLDKTGTLTTASAGGVEFQSAAGAESLGQAAQWVSALTRYSTHPGALRITHFLGSAEWPVEQFQEVPGRGLTGRVAGHWVLVGSQAWLAEQGVSLPKEAGGANVQVAVDGSYRGGFVLSNTLRPEVEQLLTALGGRCKLALLSGDNDREAARFRKILGEGAELRFQQSPMDKLEFVRYLQASGRKVMMVGDGLNDAGALKQADVGVAVVEQIGVFSPASDVILDAAELPELPRVMRFSRQAVRVVRAGFVLSGLYNIVGVSIAAAGLMAPIVCAILMPLSSATVVFFASGVTAWAGARTLRRRESPKPDMAAAGHFATATGGMV